MGSSLALHSVSAPLMLCLFYRRMYSQPGDPVFSLSFSLFWVVYVADAILLFLVCMEVFRSALAPFSGLMKFGLLIFRWVAAVSAIVCISTIPFNRGVLSTLFSAANAEQITPTIAFGLTRSVSILELCLLIFLCLSMNALRLSVRDAAFGVALGFGVLSASEFVQALLTTIFPTSVEPIHLVGGVILLFVLGIWLTYFALPERARKPVLIPADSTIYRWNEIATALGHTGTKVAVQQPANGFFLTDVERVVEMVIARNIKSSESES